MDLDCDLDQQTAFAEEIRLFFGVEREEIRDIRLTPHSGYRAVHVWLRLPAGRVEIQIRTRGQSAWANAYERLGDLAGRHIRYGETHEDPAIQRLVGHLHDASRSLANLEDHIAERVRNDAEFREVVGVMATIRDHPEFESIAAGGEQRDELVHAVEDEPRRRMEHDVTMKKLRVVLDDVVDHMEEIRRMLDEISQ